MVTFQGIQILRQHTPENVDAERNVRFCKPKAQKSVPAQEIERKRSSKRKKQYLVGKSLLRDTYIIVIFYQKKSKR